MVLPRNIILVGFMASGKSVVGRLLAYRLGWTLLDSDDEVVRRAGKSIQQIFEEEGEASFRTWERLAVADLCEGSGRVIAVGGGAFVDQVNRQKMLTSGAVFCLRASPETLCQRAARGQRSGAALRPLLAVEDPLGRIESLLKERASAYAQAHYAVDTDSLTPEEVAEHILGLCQSPANATKKGQ